MYITSIRARQNGPAQPGSTIGMQCPVLVEWAYGNQVPDRVEIYVALPNQQASLAASVTPNDEHHGEKEVSAPAGAMVEIIVAPRLLANGTTLDKMPDDQGQEQDWQSYTVKATITTSAPPADQPKPTFLPPVITSHQVHKGGIKISWNSPRKYDFFQVRWAEKGFNEVQVEINSSGSDGYFVAEPTSSGVTYTFRVEGCAKNLVGILESNCSDWSDIAEITVLPGMGVAPIPVANLTAAAVSAHHIRLDWQNPGVYTRIEVHRYRSGAAKPEQLFRFDHTRLHLDDINLLPGTAYSYRVLAFNRGGDSAEAAVEATTPRIPLAFPRHSGSFIQSTFGGWGNYELAVPHSQKLVHYWRDNDEPTFAWHRGHEFSFEAQTISEGLNQQMQLSRSVQGVSLIQSTIAGDGVHGNFDMVVRLSPTTLSTDEGDSLHLYAFDTGVGQWKVLGPIVADGRPITGVTGTPALIQSTFGQHGNYELVVPHGQKLVHYWRGNDDPSFAWHHGHELSFKSQAMSEALNQQLRLGHFVNGVALIQSTFAGDGIHGNFDMVVRLSPTTLHADEGDSLHLYTFDTGVSRWTGHGPIMVEGQPITGVTGTPALIQSTYGQHGNYELVVPHGQKLVHYYRNNDDPSFAWHRTGELPIPQLTLEMPGTPPRIEGGPVVATPTGAALVQSNLGTPGTVEAIIRMSPTIDVEGTGDYLTAYSFDSAAKQWRGPFDIVADGQRIVGVTAL